MTLLEIRDRPRFLFIVASMALGGCAQTPDIACTIDEKACPDGSYVAFFELPESPEMGRDANTPLWVQHLALRVPDEETLMRSKARIESHGVDVLGPVDHGICKSIYFFDPNGHRLELTVDTMTREMKEKLAAVSEAMMEEWTRTKRAPKHADWVHKK
jgi:glyoxylase I family protein